MLLGEPVFFLFVLLLHKWSYFLIIMKRKLEVAVEYSPPVVEDRAATIFKIEEMIVILK